MAPKPTTPSGFWAYLVRRWNEGCTMGKQLLAEIRPLGYTGSLTHLQRLLNSWRRAHFAAAIGVPVPAATAAPSEPTTHIVPPIVAAALCIKPRGLLTEAQAEKVDKLKAQSSEFAMMRQLAMRFRGIFRGSDTAPLDRWLSDAATSGIHGMRQFAATLRQDLAAVRNAICEPWSTDEIDQFFLSSCANLLWPTSDRAAKSGVRDASPAAQLSQSLLLCGTRRRPRAPFGPGFR